MSYSNGIISAPINVSDPYYVMGVGMYNGWWDIAYICSNQHGKINPAAKCKPVRSESIFQRDANWYKGDALNSGVFIEMLFFPSSSMDPTPYQRWQYHNVLENTKDWFRLDDFEGYNHNSTYPFTTIVGDVSATGFICTLIKKLNIGGQRDKMLSISDLSVLTVDKKVVSLDKLYFAVVIRETGKSQEFYQWITTPLPIGDNKSTDAKEIFLRIPTGAVSSGKSYDIFLCLTNIQSSNAMTWFYQYNNIFHVNYECNGVTNLGYKINVYPEIMENPRLMSIEWVGLFSSASGGVIGIEVEGVKLQFDANSEFLELIESSFKVELQGGILTDKNEEFIYIVSKPLNTTTVIAYQNIYFHVNSHGNVNATISQHTNEGWVVLLTQQLAV